MFLQGELIFRLQIQKMTKFFEILFYFFTYNLLYSCAFLPRMALPDAQINYYNNTTQESNLKITVIPIETFTSESMHLYSYSKYHLGVSDAITFSIWGHPEISVVNLSLIDPAYYDYTIPASKQVDEMYGLSKPYDNKSDIFIISDDGTINLPLVGKVKIVGKTQDEARQLITKNYNNYIVDPTVNIKIVAYRSQRAFVLGEVLQNQIIPISDVPLSITMALERVGGINLVTANIKQIYVLHPKSRDSVEVIAIDATNLISMLRAGQIYLQNNDIVYVSTAGLAQFNRVMTQLLPFAETFWYTTRGIPPGLVPAALSNTQF